MTMSRNVTVIPARARVGNNQETESKTKLRVAAYCRVSTDSEEQASSYEVQIEHYTSYIKGTLNGSWQEFMRTTGFQEPILKSAKSLTG